MANTLLTALAVGVAIGVVAEDGTSLQLTVGPPAGAALNAPANPGDNNKLAIANAGNLTYGSATLTNLTQIAGSTAANQFLQGNGAGIANSWGTLNASPANPGDNNKVTIASAGALVYQFLVDANVSATAALAVSKLAASGVNGQAIITTAGVPTWSTDFVAENLTTTGNLLLNNTASVLRIGTTTAGATRAATVGAIRMATGLGLYARNSTDLVDLQVFLQTGTSDLDFGDITNVVNLNLKSSGVGGFTRLIVGATTAIQIGTVNTQIATALTLNNAQFAFGSAIAAPVISQNSAATAQTLTLAAQTATGASNPGGLLVLAGGDSTNGTPGLVGGVRLRLAQAAANQNAIEARQLATATRVVALCRQINVSTTDMPANSGDWVLYLANAQVNPTADAVNGHVYYSDGAKPAWRYNGTNFRMNGTSATANTTGGGLTLPLLAAGYLDVQVNGTQQKIPYYAA